MNERIRRHVSEAWASRHAIEVEASGRFAMLSQRLASVAAPQELVSLAGRAAEDERRHAGHCEVFAVKYGRALQSPPPHGVVEYAPTRLSPFERLTYELVAQCCVAETQSTTTLLTLLEAAEDDHLRDVLRELSGDEVSHARLGWGYLAWASAQGDVRFLSALLPSMIEGSAGTDMFARARPGEDEPGLLLHGVVPKSARLRKYVDTLEQVVLPGFRSHGVDTGPVTRWLEAKTHGVEGRC